MDPLSIAGTVGGLTSAFLGIAKKINDVITKFQGATQTLQSIHNEIRSITFCLSQLQNLLLSGEDSLPSQALLDPHVLDVLDIALTGCSITLSCIEEEIRKLVVKLENDQKIGLGGKFVVVWKDEEIKALLYQLRGQSSAINLVLQGLQMQSLRDIYNSLEKNQATIDQIACRTKSLRAMYSKLKFASSVFEPPDVDSTFGRPGSIISDTTFAFDDQVVNSLSYRRALAAATTHNPARRQNNHNLIDGDLLDLDLVLVNLDESDETTEDISGGSWKPSKDLDLLLTPISEEDARNLDGVCLEPVKPLIPQPSSEFDNYTPESSQSPNEELTAKDVPLQPVLDYHSDENEKINSGDNVPIATSIPRKKIGASSRYQTSHLIELLEGVNECQSQSPNKFAEHKAVPSSSITNPHSNNHSQSQSVESGTIQPHHGVVRESCEPPHDLTDRDRPRDIPCCLRSLRLHKYTDQLKNLSWAELVKLDDEGLQKRGINALGARRKLLKVCEQLKADRDGVTPLSTRDPNVFSRDKSVLASRVTNRENITSKFVPGSDSTKWGTKGKSVVFANASVPVTSRQAEFITEPEIPTTPANKPSSTSTEKRTSTILQNHKNQGKQNTESATEKKSTAPLRREVQSRAPNATRDNHHETANPKRTSQIPDNQTHSLPEVAPAFTHAFERWETLSAHWEGLTSFWIRRLEEDTDLIAQDVIATQLSRQVTDLAAAGSNLFRAVVELQRLRASSERKFQRWFFETKAEQERSQERIAELEKALETAQHHVREVSEYRQEAFKELQDTKNEALRAWEKIECNTATETERANRLEKELSIEIGDMVLIPCCRDITVEYRPHSFQMVRKPTVPKGWKVMWIDEKRQWSYINPEDNKAQSCNPKLLESVEEAIKGLIDPELSAFRREQSKGETRRRRVSNKAMNSGLSETPRRKSRAIKVAEEQEPRHISDGF